jgi:hypothetical protein
MALVSLVSINVWRLAGDTLNITCNFLYSNHHVHRDFLITLYFVMFHNQLGSQIRYYGMRLRLSFDQNVKDIHFGPNKNLSKQYYHSVHYF